MGKRSLVAIPNTGVPVGLWIKFMKRGEDLLGSAYFVETVIDDGKLHL
jgi:hypothetical protein